jgi:hypothetical protein
VKIKGITSLALVLLITATYGFLFVLNFSRNLELAESTKVRDVQYQAWKFLTTETDFFRRVEDRDVMLSLSQDDSFEYNAGTFYVNTGIRLAYFYNTLTIFPNFNECQKDSICELPDLRETIKSTLPNLNRVKVITEQKIKEDWVLSNMQEGALDQSEFWATDLILLTPTTLLAYLGRFDESTPVSIERESFKAILLTLGQREFTPSLFGVCMVETRERPGLNNNKFRTSVWQLPSKGLSPNGKVLELPNSVDYRELNVGTCVK